MTTPKVDTIKRGDSRFYVHPDTGTKAPGVTSIINMLPKPFLTRWAAKATAEYAVENVGAIVQLVLADPVGAVALLKGAPWRDTTQAADTGTAVHELFERLANGENIRRVQPELEPYLSHFHEFLAEFKPTFLYQEETVWSEQHNYAGSFDALMEVDGQLLWTDYKTTRSGVHAEVSLQLSAYAHADHILQGDGSQLPLPQSDQGVVLHVRPEGWSLVPVRIDDEVFSYFLHLREVFDWDRDVNMTVLGKALNADPLVNKRGQQRARF
jgi:hypothetical protein